MAALFQCLGFIHEEIGSQHHTIANDIDLTSLEDTRGDRAQHVLLAFELQRVAGIRTALKTGNNIILRGQHVDHLTFTFIAPLQSQQDINFTLIHLLFVFVEFFILFCRVILA